MYIKAQLRAGVISDRCACAELPVSSSPLDPADLVGITFFQWEYHERRPLRVKSNVDEGSATKMGCCCHAPTGAFQVGSNFVGDVALR